MAIHLKCHTLYHFMGRKKSNQKSNNNVVVYESKQNTMEQDVTVLKNDVTALKKDLSEVLESLVQFAKETSERVQGVEKQQFFLTVLNRRTIFTMAVQKLLLHIIHLEEPNFPIPYDMTQAAFFTHLFNKVSNYESSVCKTHLKRPHHDVMLAIECVVKAIKKPTYLLDVPKEDQEQFTILMEIMKETFGDQMEWIT